MDSTALPLPDVGRSSAVHYVETHFQGLFLEAEARPSETFRGGQSWASAALAALDLTNFAVERNNAYPERLRKSSRLSPYIRHGLVSLGEVAAHALEAPGQEPDRRRFLTELQWQEYARHWYARLGTRTAASLRYGRSPAPAEAALSDAALDLTMGCLELPKDELEEDGWLVGQTRQWLAGHWSSRLGRDWRVGEDYFFRHLLDGSRAANRLGWQQAAGASSARAYGFTRWQVEHRAPGLCATCESGRDCPIDYWPQQETRVALPSEPLLSRDPDLGRTSGPLTPLISNRTKPEAVWLTAESLGSGDPALAANPELAAVFVFDQPLLQRLQLSSKRLVFMVETLAELAIHRPLEVHLGDPVDVLAGRPVAATFTPVPGWRKLSTKLDVVEQHPWPWLVMPHAGRIGSFDEWLLDAETQAGQVEAGSEPPGSERSGSERSAAQANSSSGRRYDRGVFSDRLERVPRDSVSAEFL